MDYAILINGNDVVRLRGAAGEYIDAVATLREMFQEARHNGPKRSAAEKAKVMAKIAAAIKDAEAKAAKAGRTFTMKEVLG